MTRHNRDILWKGLIEWVFGDMLRFVFPNAEALFDMQKGFDFLDKELADLSPASDINIGVRAVDKLVKVRRKDVPEESAFFHIEFQHTTKAEERYLFGERMFRYSYRCFDKNYKPFVALAIYSGPDGNQFPKRYTKELMNTRHTYEYNSLSLLDHLDEDLAGSGNPFAWAMLAAKMALIKGRNRDAKLLEGKLEVFKILFKNGLFQSRKLQAILTFLKNYAHFKNSDFNRTFTTEIDKITGKPNTMDIFEQVAEIRHQEGLEEGLAKGIEKGLAKGLEKGRVQGREELVRTMLEKTEFSEEYISSTFSIPIKLVRRLSKEVRTGTTNAK